MQRRFELDSLRGVAALSVLLYHALATNSATLTAGLALQPVQGVVANVLIYSPAHVLWLGAEAVWLFFVLSGFVLTKSAMRPGFSWQVYFPSRIVRLYLPVFGAVALAWVTYLYPHTLRAGMDPLLPVAYRPEDVLRDLTLLGGTSTSLGVLWSLQWEVLFSLALPLFLFAAIRWPRSSPVVALTVCLIGWWLGDPLTSFMPMFLFGVVLAMKWDQIAARLRWLGSGQPLAHVVGAVALLAAICGLTSFFLVGPWLGASTRLVTLPVVLASIIGLICLAQKWPPLTAVLTIKPLVALGKISYSLYLVHLPIVVLAVFLFGAGALSTITGITVALLVSVAFYFAVERPAHLLSRRVGDRLRAQTAGATTRRGPTAAS